VLTTREDRHVPRLSAAYGIGAAGRRGLPPERQPGQALSRRVGRGRRLLAPRRNRGTRGCRRRTRPRREGGSGGGRGTGERDRRRLRTLGGVAEPHRVGRRYRPARPDSSSGNPAPRGGLLSSCGRWISVTNSVTRLTPVRNRQIGRLLSYSFS